MLILIREGYILFFIKHQCKFICMFCHSEQSEESGILHQILSFAQNDKKIKYTNNFNQVLTKKVIFITIETSKVHSTKINRLIWA